MLKSESML